MARTFDEPALLDRVDHDMSFLAETVQMLTSYGPLLVEQIRKAIASNDAPTLARHAHALKGMVSNFCAQTTLASALELEKIGKNGDLSSAAPAIRALEEQMDALTTELVWFIKARA